MERLWLCWRVQRWIGSISARYFMMFHPLLIPLLHPPSIHFPFSPLPPLLPLLPLLPLHSLLFCLPFPPSLLPLPPLPFLPLPFLPLSFFLLFLFFLFLFFLFLFFLFFLLSLLFLSSSSFFLPPLPFIPSLPSCPSSFSFVSFSSSWWPLWVSRPRGCLQRLQLPHRAFITNIAETTILQSASFTTSNSFETAI